MKKKAKILSVIAVLVIITAVVARFFKPSVFYGYMYPFSRIRGNVALTIDGKEIPLSECDIECTHNYKSQKLHINGSRIKNRGGEYGSYKYIVSHGDTEFMFSVNNFNCWNCTDYDVKFSVDTAKNTVSCSGWSTYLCEDGSKSDKSTIDETAEFNEFWTPEIRVAN